MEVFALTSNLSSTWEVFFSSQNKKASFSQRWIRKLPAVWKEQPTPTKKWRFGKCWGRLSRGLPLTRTTWRKEEPWEWVERNQTEENYEYKKQITCFAQCDKKLSVQCFPTAFPFLRRTSLQKIIVTVFKSFFKPERPWEMYLHLKSWN